jgi:hypothetical protein
MKKLSILAMLVSFISLFALGSSLGQVADRVEEIYVVRSMRESRGAPTEFCGEARTRFANVGAEDQYTFRSTAIRGSDGLMINANVQTVGRLRACFGATSDPALFNFYGEGALGTATFTGRGECRVVKQDYPEPGIQFLRCFLDLSDLPKGYVGGQLTTSSINSRNVLGNKSDPPGYTQPSIATIRLWKQR